MKTRCENADVSFLKKNFRNFRNKWNTAYQDLYVNNVLQWKKIIPFMKKHLIVIVDYKYPGASGQAEGK